MHNFLRRDKHTINLDNSKEKKVSRKDFFVFVWGFKILCHGLGNREMEKKKRSRTKL